MMIQPRGTEWAGAALVMTRTQLHGIRTGTEVAAEPPVSQVQQSHACTVAELGSQSINLAIWQIRRRKKTRHLRKVLSPRDGHTPRRCRPSTPHISLEASCEDYPSRSAPNDQALQQSREIQALALCMPELLPFDLDSKDYGSRQVPAPCT